MESWSRLSEEESAFLNGLDRAAEREGVGYAEWSWVHALIDRLSVPPVAPEVEGWPSNDGRDGFGGYEHESASAYRARLIAAGVLRAPDGETDERAMFREFAADTGCLSNGGFPSAPDGEAKGGE